MATLQSDWADQTMTAFQGFWKKRPRLRNCAHALKCCHCLGHHIVDLDNRVGGFVDQVREIEGTCPLGKTKTETNVINFTSKNILGLSTLSRSLGILCSRASGDFPITGVGGFFWWRASVACLITCAEGLFDHGRQGIFRKWAACHFFNIHIMVLVVGLAFIYSMRGLPKRQKQTRKRT